MFSFFRKEPLRTTTVYRSSGFIAVEARLARRKRRVKAFQEFVMRNLLLGAGITLFLLGICILLIAGSAWLYSTKKTAAVVCELQSARDNELIKLYAGRGASFTYSSIDSWKTEAVMRAAVKAIKE